MDLLLDTNALIWFLEGDAQLSTAAKNTIEHPQNRRFVSIASLWEMAIKISLGKLVLMQPLPKVFQEIRNNGIDILSINTSHVLQTIHLPFHHRDPFDRMLIGQALEEKMIIVSKDENFDQYGTTVIW
ncbi:MAG: type II toxin-antitoxin system VapC family toxin [Cytophagales bacterium]|jgi:PIN domain nuclease of toxin-antitoxin system|nr:type II toxin-antitoxin system VapC family toxin [Cytophagales bacterium]